MGPEISIFNPDALGTPAGQYSHVARVKAAALLFIAGQLSTDTSCTIVGADDFDAQCRQVFANIEAALTSAGAGWGQFVQFTTYLTRAEDVPPTSWPSARESFLGCSRAARTLPTPCSSSMGWFGMRSSSRCIRSRRSSHRESVNNSNGLRRAWPQRDSTV